MKLPDSVTRTFGRAVLQSKKNSPHLFFAAGLVGVVGSTILACRATLKLEKIVDEIQEEFKRIHSDKLSADKGILTYSRDEYIRDLTFAYINGAKKLAILYGPSAVIGSVSIAALTGSHIQLTRRNAALTAAVASVSKAYDEYRNRVRDELGEEKELAIYQGCLLDDPDELNNSGALNKIVKIANGTSPYSRFFEPSNPNWQKDMEYNRTFIQCQQNYANHLLNARGHVFLNEVYDQLGLDRCPAGAVVGWVLGGEGDGYIDFGLFDAPNVDFINGNARGCLLDFNVDGVVYDKI